jgi:uncharacterized protein (TIGR03086 family)
MSPSDKVRYQGEAVSTLIGGMSADQMDNATPCAKWQTRDLLGHLVGGGTMLGMALKGEPMETDPDAPMPDLLGDDPQAAWDQAIQVFFDGADSDGAMERTLDLEFGPTPGAVLLDIISFDLLVHAWDLAQATGQDFDPPADIVEPAMAIAKGMLAPEMRDGDTFAAEVTPPQGASRIEQLAAFTGRAV